MNTGNFDTSKKCRNRFRESNHDLATDIHEQNDIQPQSFKLKNTDQSCNSDTILTDSDDDDQVFSQSSYQSLPASNYNPPKQFRKRLQSTNFALPEKVKTKQEIELAKQQKMTSILSKIQVSKNDNEESGFSDNCDDQVFDEQEQFVAKDTFRQRLFATSGR